MREKAIKIKRKRCASDWFLDIFKVVFLVLVTVICVYPFWNIFVVSINDATDALRGGLYFLPRKLSLASYKDILGRATFLHGILITVLRTAIGTPLAVLVTTALAYVLSRKELLFRKQLNLMLTGQNYPDIVLMDRGNDIVNRYIEAGALLPLNDLIDKYGPDVKEMYGETLNKSRYTDGKNYYLNNWYGEDPDPVAGVLMRYDYLCEIVGKDRADSDEPFTQEEYIDICKKFKELHPTIDGKESIAITFDAESKNYDGTLKGMYGLKTYYQDGDNLEHVAKAPNFKEMMSFANELYTEGLLDKEWVVNKKNQWTQKLSAGNVFSTFASYWDTDAANTALASSVGGDAKFYSYKILGNGISADETTYSGRSTLGWDAIAITKNCKNPEAAMKMINYLASEEGQYLLMWGIEGTNWNMEDGKHVPNDDLIEGFQTDFDKTKLDTGVRKWTWFVKNGNGTDGTPYDVTQYKVKETRQVAMNHFGENDRWDTAEFAGLTPAGSTPDGLKWQKIQDIYDQEYPKIVNADSHDAAMEEYDKMISEMNDAGLEDVEKVITQNYQERMKLWNE